MQLSLQCSNHAGVHNPIYRQLLSRLFALTIEPGLLTMQPSARDNDEVTDVNEAMMWCQRGFERIANCTRLTANGLARLFSNRRITSSGVFSGIGSAELAHGIIDKTADRFIDSLPAHDRPLLGPMTSFSAWGIERDHSCQEALIAHPFGPECIFSDVLDILPPQARLACGLDGGTELQAAQLKEVIIKSKVDLSAWCVRHGRKCRLQRTHMHVAGTPCINHSSMGKRELFSGSAAKLFFAWARLMRVLLIPIIFHENVPAFGTEALSDILGDLYIIVRCLICPTQLGWATARKRQISVLLLKAFILPQLADSSHAQTQLVAEQRLDIENTVLMIFGRRRGFSWRAFLGTASNDELRQELQWASQRPGVRKRRQASACEDMFRDGPNSFLGALTLPERRRFQ